MRTRVVVWLLLVAASIVFVSPSASGQEERNPIRLIAPRILQPAFGVLASTAGLVDGDGHMDIVIANNRSEIEIYAGRGDGFFGSPRTLSLGALGQALLAADIDLDGDGDLLAACDGLPLAILFGDGVGNLGPPRSILLGGTGRSLSIGDFNEDGLPDVAVAVSSGTVSRVSVLLGVGGGEFGPPIALATGAGPRSLVVADLDGDSHLDVAAANSGSDDVSVFLGDGAGGFSSGALFSAGDRPFGIGVGDVDGDGAPDLVTANNFGDDISLLLGDGNGGFEPPLPIAAIESPLAVSLVDMNEDGHLDLVTGGFETAVHLGDGSAAFSRVADVWARAWPTLTATDMDADAHVDLLHGPQIAFGDGRGGLGLGTAIALGSSPEAVVAGDLDGDGDVDLATALVTSKRVSISLNEGGGGFARAADLVTRQWPLDLVAADYDGDGDLDMAVANSGTNLVSYYSGLGDGTFAAEVPYATGAPPTAIEAIDVDSDGRLDLVSASRVSDDVTVRLGGGDGTFGNALTSPAASGIGATLFMATGDFDEDALVDIALSTVDSRGSEIIQVLRGDGSGLFAEMRRISADRREVESLVAADLDVDGHFDLAFSSNSYPEQLITVLSGNGAGDFARRVPINVEGHALGLAIADIDDDGTPDVVAANTTHSSGISVFRGRGPDGFAEPMHFGVYLASGVVAADLDSDGRADVAVASYVGGSLLVVRNRTFDTFVARRGNVELAAGPARPVLSVNGSAGAGDQRRVLLDRRDPVEIAMAAPPLDPDGTAAFGFYVWKALPRPADVRRLPLGYGFSCLPMPLSGGSPALRKTANNTGDPALGVANVPSSAAPSVIASAPGGIGREGVYFVQGLIEDTNSPSGAYAVTNGIRLDVR